MRFKQNTQTNIDVETNKAITQKKKEVVSVRMILTLI